MTRDIHGRSRRTFLRTTATAVATTTVAATTGLAGCSALPGGGDDGPNPPDYDEQAATELVRKSFPQAPAAFPVEIPDARFRAHESRARELLDAVPEDPDLPNETIAERIARERSDLTGRLGDMERTQTPRDRLGRWRYYRDHAAEVWGSYVAATDQYSTEDFQTRYDQLRATYNEFDGNWNYRGPDSTEALVVHHAIERLVSRGLDDVLTTGPFPTDPPAAVFQAGRMVQAHERAAANLADGRAFRDRFLADQTSSPSHRLTFAAATERLRHPVETETRREPYDRALEEGRSELDVDIGRGPAGRAFQHARRYAKGADRAVRRARDQNDPATATIRAGRYRHTHHTFRATVDAIYDGDISWPEDVAGLRRLRADTIQALETAWNTEPRHLAVELTTIAADVLGHASPRRHHDAVEDHDLADYVGTLHYVKRYANGVPDLTRTVVDAITA